MKFTTTGAYIMAIKMNRWKIVPHPECQPGELWIGNLVGDEAFEGVGWKTKRRGITGQSEGKPIEDPAFRPIFVQRSEVEADGFEVYE